MQIDLNKEQLELLKYAYYGMSVMTKKKREYAES